MTNISSNIAGIPCLIEVTHCSVVEGSFRHDAPSDWDFYGYSEVEFNVLDRRGRPAAWLERKMTDSDRKRIENEILEDL